MHLSFKPMERTNKLLKSCSAISHHQNRLMLVMIILCCFVDLAQSVQSPAVTAESVESEDDDFSFNEDLLCVHGMHFLPPGVTFTTGLCHKSFTWLQL